MELRRICVFGAGAIGGHLAAKLAAAGHDVSVVARGANLAAMQAKGVALREGAHADARSIAGRVRASDQPGDLGPQDVVFVTTKATALAEDAQSSGSTSHKPSMLQDYESGRPMEVEAMLAAPCAFARAAGVAAPTLEALHALIARLATRKRLYSPT